MKRLISVPITFFLMASTASAQVSQFVFITEPQTVSIGVSSETITIQSQNSQGVSENITETHDLVFTSISPTGQFFNTSGNPVSTTMSKNTANKNFLYQDSTVGTYTLTITATGRTSLQSFSASQQITIGGESSSSSNSTTTNEQTSTETTTDQSSSSQTNTANSAHSSPAPLSSTENKIEFEVSAGRDRLTAVGNPVIFIASPTKLQNLPEQAITYKWSFGDGTTLLGKTVTHNYRHAGNYAIVLNAYGSDKQAVSRINVKVILPLISLQRVSDGIEIENKSGPEINLGEIQAKINEVKVALNNISPALQGDNTKIASVQKVEVVTKQLEQEEQEK